MKVILKATEARALGFQSSEPVEFDLPMRNGQKDNVICVVGASSRGGALVSTPVGAIRISGWLKPASASGAVTSEVL